MAKCEKCNDIGMIYNQGNYGWDYGGYHYCDCEIGIAEGKKYIKAYEKMLTKDEAIEELCKIMCIANLSKGDYIYSTDGVCKRCNIEEENFRNSGAIIDYIKQAVIEKLQRDGFEIQMPGYKNHG